MRKTLITAAAALSAIAIAAPASAQWAQSPRYGYGHNQNYGAVRSLQARVDRLQWEIRKLDRRNVLTNREARRLMKDANGIEYRLRRASRNGLNYVEVRDIQTRLQRLEWNIQREARDGNRYRKDRYGYGYGFPDRDRDGRDDRYEDDRGRKHDHH